MRRPARIKLQPTSLPSTRVIHDLLQSGAFEISRVEVLENVRAGRALFTRPAGLGRAKEWLIANKSLLDSFEWTVETLREDDVWVPAPEQPKG
jgi:hypothetical protein